MKAEPATFPCVKCPGRVYVSVCALMHWPVPALYFVCVCVCVWGGDMGTAPSWQRDAVCTLCTQHANSASTLQCSAVHFNAHTQTHTHTRTHRRTHTHTHTHTHTAHKNTYTHTHTHTHVHTNKNTRTDTNTHIYTQLNVWLHVSVRLRHCLIFNLERCLLHRIKERCNACLSRSLSVPLFTSLSQNVLSLSRSLSVFLSLSFSLSLSLSPLQGS